MNIQKEINQFKKLLGQEADEKYKKGTSTTVPSALKHLGVRVPIVRKIAKEWVKENKEISEIEFLKLLQALWKQPVFEPRSLAQELLIANKKYWKKFDWKVGESWLNDVDNWVHCDVLSWQIFGFLVLWDKSHLKNLKSYLKKPGKWHRRAGIVSLLQLIRQKEIRPDEVLVMIDEIIDDQDPMIQKAISWVLREMVRAGYDKEIEKYLAENKDKLAGYAVREVTNKLKTGLKSGKNKLV
jgi:3-methyladenine DNA glycosylase AlkD